MKNEQKEMESDVRLRKEITQFSTMHGLLGRLYKGAFPVSVIEEAGKIGIGCGDCMDGEMIMDDHCSYIGRIHECDMRLHRMDKNELVPFAEVAPFTGEGEFVGDGLTKESFDKALIEAVGTENLFVAVRVTGTFSRMDLRLAPKAEEPFPSLVDLFSKQQEFSMNPVKGTLIGFWAPKAYHGMTVAGLHAHFMDENKERGGHIMNFAIEKGTVTYETYHNFSIRLPEHDDLRTADLDVADKADDIRKVEG